LDGVDEGLKGFGEKESLGDFKFKVEVLAEFLEEGKGEFRGALRHPFCKSSVAGLEEGEGALGHESGMTQNTPCVKWDFVPGGSLVPRWSTHPSEYEVDGE
jgi:hypothetical protein